MARTDSWLQPAWLLLTCVIAGCAGLPPSRGLPGVAERAMSRGVTLPPAAIADVPLPAFQREQPRARPGRAS